MLDKKGNTNHKKLILLRKKMIFQTTVFLAKWQHIPVLHTPHLLVVGTDGRVGPVEAQYTSI